MSVMVLASSDHVLEASRRDRKVSSTVPHTLGKGGQNGAPSPPMGRDCQIYPEHHHQALPGHWLQLEGLWVEPGLPLLVHSSHTPARPWCPSRQGTSWVPLALQDKQRRRCCGLERETGECLQ